MNNYQHQQNPFARSNPFHIPTKFYSKSPAYNLQGRDYDHLYYQRQVQPRMDMWQFNKSNVGSSFLFQSKVHDKEQSNFEKSLKGSCITPFKNSSKASKNMRQSKVYENPFYKKNLLVDEQKVREQLEMDLSLANYHRFGNSRQNYRQNLKVSTYVYDYANQLQKSGIENENYSFASKNKSQKHNESPQKASMQKIEEQRKYEEENDRYKEEITVRGHKFYRNVVYSRRQNDG